MHPALKVAAVSLLALPVIFLAPSTHYEVAGVEVSPSSPVAGEEATYAVTINNTGEEPLEFTEGSRLELRLDGETVTTRRLLVDPNVGGAPRYLSVPPGEQRTWDVEAAAGLAGDRRAEVVLEGTYRYGDAHLGGEARWSGVVSYRNPPVEGLDVWVTASGDGVKHSVAVAGGRAFTGNASLALYRDGELVGRESYRLRGENEFSDTIHTEPGRYELVARFAGTEERAEFRYAGEDGEVLHRPGDGSGGVSISTAQTGGGGEFGLLPMWQAAYNGSGAAFHDYDFDDDGTDETRQCGNCHMGGGSKHEPPLHPLGLGSLDTGEWFFDDGKHRGPNTRLPDQMSGIFPGVQCGGCHTPTNPAGFATGGAEASNDPHSVHRDVITREGCVRCHTYDERQYGRQPVPGGPDWRYRQGGADRASFGIVDLVNMTRSRDGQFLSTAAEAAYGPGGGNGTGWNRYGAADAGGSVRFGCGDCHGLYHAGRGLNFTFDDSVDSRAGPVATVSDAQSWGVATGQYRFTCGACHVTDAHAVHTNGEINDSVSFPQMQDPSVNPTRPGARGAEMCGECHAQAIAEQRGGHFDLEAGQLLGLRGERDAEPDRRNSMARNADCGFCHV